MQLAQRIDQLPPYLFAEISRKIVQKREAGVDVVSFGIADPDLPAAKTFWMPLKRVPISPRITAIRSQTVCLSCERRSRTGNCRTPVRGRAGREPSRRCR